MTTEDLEIEQIIQKQWSTLHDDVIDSIRSNTYKSIVKNACEKAHLSSPELLETVTFEVLLTLIDLQTGSEFVDILESNSELSTDQRKIIIDEIQKNLFSILSLNVENELVTSDPTDKIKFSDLTPKDLVGLDIEFLGKEETVRQIDLQMLLNMQKNGLSQEKRKAIQKTVESQHEELKRPNISPTTLTQKEQDNIDKLYAWFNDNNRMPV